MNFTTIEDALHAMVVAASGLSASQVLWANQAVQRPSGVWISLGPLDITPVGFDWVNAVVNPLVLADDDVEVVTAATDTLTLTGHSYQTGDGPVRFTTTGTLPAGLALLTDYWIVVSDADNIQVAASYAESVAAVPTVVDITDAGTGTHTISDTADTLRQGEEINHTVRGRRYFELQIQAFGCDATGPNRPAAVLNNIVSKHVLPSVIAGLDAADVSIARFTPVQEFELVLGNEIESRGLVTAFGHLAEEVTELGTIIETAELVEDPPIS